MRNYGSIHPYFSGIKLYEFYGFLYMNHNQIFYKLNEQHKVIKYCIEAGFDQYSYYATIGISRELRDYFNWDKNELQCEIWFLSPKWKAFNIPSKKELLELKPKIEILTYGDDHLFHKEKMIMEFYISSEASRRFKPASWLFINSPGFIDNRFRRLDKIINKTRGNQIMEGFYEDLIRGVTDHYSTWRAR